MKDNMKKFFFSVALLVASQNCFGGYLYQVSNKGSADLHLTIVGQQEITCVVAAGETASLEDEAEEITVFVTDSDVRRTVKHSENSVLVFNDAEDCCTAVTETN